MIKKLIKKIKNNNFTISNAYIKNWALIPQFKSKSLTKIRSRLKVKKCVAS